MTEIRRLITNEDDFESGTPICPHFQTALEPWHESYITSLLCRVDGLLSDEEVQKIVEEHYVATANRLRNETSILIFGPGEKSEGFDDREALRVSLASVCSNVIYPERGLGNTILNKSLAEGFLIEQFNLVFVLLVGIGPSIEFSHYMKFERMARKFRILQQAQYRLEQSFLNEVLRPFCRLYNFCYNYQGKEELIEKAQDSLEDYINFTIAFGHRPA
jgi:hypothetical protein